MTRHLRNEGMRRTLGLAILAGLAVALAGAGTARAQTQITSCPYTITAPGTYVLANDIGPCSGDGIDIKASNVNLMLNDYIITGSNNGTGSGINISFNSSYTNIHIKGPGLIRDFANGIYLVDVQNSQIQNLVTALNGDGVLSNTGANIQFNGNVFARNGFISGGTTDGITLNGDSNDQVQNNDASGNNGSGITDGGSGDQVHNNNTGGNLGTAGIYLEGTNAQVHDNTAFGNAYDGIFVLGQSGPDTIHNNTAEGNAHYDLEDDNYPSCDSDTWHNDTFFTANQSCIH